ncbi:ribonuclease H-like domain-containing protein [Mycena leptocephala]|nr:ribonuclease H-like domain-containing protein [Mycena leptocephala]
MLILPLMSDPSAVTHAKAVMGNGNDGVWTGTSFEAPANTSPEDLFPATIVENFSPKYLERFCIHPRFVPAVSVPKTMMIYTDGACSFNGLDSPRGGFAFVFNRSPGGKCSSALEQKGPDGQIHVHTSNRAELRAVIAALKFRAWRGEGWKRIVIVTDSEYVGKGATTWMRKWARNAWCTSSGKQAANRDLWEALSEAMGCCADGGCEVSFWMVSRKWNTLADAAAKAAIQLESAAQELTSKPVKHRQHTNRESSTPNQQL